MTDVYTILVPVYNSEQTLEELFQRTRDTFAKLQLDFEMILIEDCGSDKSWEKIKALKLDNPGLVTAIKLSKNVGQHNALMCGFNYVKGSYIITIDDDLQIPPEEIEKLIVRQKETNAELIYGIYGEKQHNIFRNFGSNIVQKVVRYVFKTNGNITSFRLLTRTLTEQLRTHDQNYIFIDGLLHWHTQYIERVLVSHEKRKHGHSNYTFAKLMKLASNLVFKFTTFPLRTLSYMGFIFSILSFFTGIAFLVRKLIYDVPLGYTSLIVTIFFSTSVLLLVLGVIGEYVGRLYVLQNKKPQYSIKQIL